MLDSFAIVYACPTGEMLIIPQTSFTKEQVAAILHMVARAGQQPEPLAPVPGFEPLADQQQVVHEVDRPSGVTCVAEQVGSALSPGATMQANREAAKVYAAERAQQARGMGYTGDLCSQCGSDRMKRNGSCLCCESCGATTGCS